MSEKATNRLQGGTNAPPPPPPQLYLLGLGFCLLYAAYSSLEVLAIPTLRSLGACSLALVHASMMLSALTAPHLTRTLGPKLACTCASLTFAVFTLAFASARPALMLASSALLGAGSGLLWTARGLLVEELSTPSTGGRNNGIFYALFRCARIVGNLLTAVLLRKGWGMPAVLASLLSLSLLGSCCFLALMFMSSAPAIAKAQHKALHSKDNPQTPKGRPNPCSQEALAVLFSSKFLSMSGLMLGVCGLGKGWLSTSFSGRIGEKDEISLAFALYGIMLVPMTYIGGAGLDSLTTGTNPHISSFDLLDSDALYQ